ncbi:helix-turn-helix domain-containing protein [Pandoraea sputorum]|uniref:Helix-hairpin-helix DNA-binding motif-containing protein n=1 Tax=Pandoraea sputorum TaxID=93222 RepID=A0A5E5ANB2_9BURK|nr:helix-turn-helix transcriptional regulator [Pandoraea sputorum]VVE74934.1 helix-hairpin-helix DNA-binding motif-containing protein [Pandoraea sputorum]
MQTNPLALFGDHLARLRKARGWSQEKLALESGLARSYVSGIERGRRNVALVNICVLADTLGVPTSEMLRFAQAGAGNAEDASMTSERTPLPQISRSLCKLENRDQVWLAEIIRSLSSRLSHAAPPAATSAYAPSSPGTASAGVHAGPFHDVHNVDDGDDMDDADSIDAVGGFDHVTRSEAPPTSFDGTAARAAIGPDFDTRFPVRHQLSSASPETFPGVSETSVDTHDPATNASAHHIGDPDPRRDSETNLSPRTAAAPGAGVIAREESLRWPRSDDERE